MSKDTGELIKIIVERYEESKEKDENPSSVHYGITRKKKKIVVDIDGEAYFLTRQELADKPDGVGDELANKIWGWIHS